MSNKETTISDFINSSGYKANKADYAFYLKKIRRPYKRIIGETFVQKAGGIEFKIIKRIKEHNDLRTYSRDLKNEYVLKHKSGYIKYRSYYQLRKYYV